ncbi:hypothetical protein BGZ50_007334 [Haplosporangium sp. Z 11]|nr:hypothetical protein BGZ50_007334 [Haplosporangium sp. Z 11]
MLQSQPQSCTTSPYLGQAPSNNAVSFAAESPFVATVSTIPGSEGLDLFSVDSVTSSMPSSCCCNRTKMYNSAPGSHFSSAAGTSSSSSTLTLDTVKIENSSPTAPMMTTAELALLCTSSEGLQCFGDHQTHRSIQTDSPLSSYSFMGEEDDMTFMATATTTQASSRIRARPKSMIVSSQPYMSPFHKDTMSSPSSPVTMRHTRAKHPGALPLVPPKAPKVAKFKTEES